MAMTWEWQGDFENIEVNVLHAEAFDHPRLDDDWKSQVNEHSLGWVCARDDDKLVGFVNVAWDGEIHAFVLDTMVAKRVRGRGVGTRLSPLLPPRRALQAANGYTLTSMII